MKKNWLRNVMINLSLLILSPILFFTLAELVVAILIPQKEWKNPPRLFQRSEALGGLHVLVPNYDGKTYEPDFGPIGIRTNSRGLRDHREYDGKRDGVFRILAIGDSFTYGLGVEYDKTYLRLLEQTLNNHVTPERVEIVKAGVPSYQTPDELSFLKHIGLTFEPDMVLLGFIAEDMIFKDNPKRNIGGGKPSDTSPSILSAFKASSLVGFERKLRQSSHFYKWIAGYLSQGLILKVFVQKRAADSFLLADYPPKWQKLWSDTEGYLQEMYQVLHARDIPFAIFVMPLRLQMAMHQLQLEGKRFDASKPTKLVQAFGKAHGVPVLDLMPRFLDVAQDRELFFRVDGHPNAHGTALIASELDTFLRQHPALKQHFASKITQTNNEDQLIPKPARSMK